MSEYSGFLGEKDSGNHQAQNAAEQKQRTQNRKQLRDQRLARSFLIYHSDGSVGHHIVIQEIGEDKNRQRQHQRPQGEFLEFLFHHFLFLRFL